MLHRKLQGVPAAAAIGARQRKLVEHRQADGGLAMVSKLRRKPIMPASALAALASIEAEYVGCWVEHADVDRLRRVCCRPAGRAWPASPAPGQRDAAVTVEVGLSAFRIGGCDSTGTLIG
jgi:hypothetical protein